MNPIHPYRHKHSYRTPPSGTTFDASTDSSMSQRSNVLYKSFTIRGLQSKNRG